jgi:CheY-like chemotaxis protein
MSSASEAPARRPIDILLVEDEELAALNVERALAGCPDVSSVLIARDGHHALELLRAGVVSRDRLVVLLDLHMPRMGGLEFLRELRRDEALRRVPAVVLTTSRDPRDQEESWSRHIAGYVVKPRTMAELRECLTSLSSYFAHIRFPTHAEVLANPPR